MTEPAQSPKMPAVASAPTEPELPVESDGRMRVRADAAARGIRIDLIARPEASSLAEAAAVLGLDIRLVVKTLVVKRHDGEFLFVLVPGDRQISWSKLRAIVGVNKLRLPEATIALAVTGYERGTITPFGSRTALPVIADELVTGRIALGAGEHGHSLFVDAVEFLTGFDATVADVTDPLAIR